MSDIFPLANTRFMTKTLSLSSEIDRFLVSSVSDVLTRLQSVDSDIVVLAEERPEELDLAIGPVVQSLPNFEKRASLTRVQSHATVSSALSEMGLASEQLVSQMVGHIELFANLFEQEKMEVRIELTDRQSCPKFHCDNVFVRMLVTYYGPTTEFIDHREPEIIFRAPLSTVVFLKGHKHPTYQDRILHRSPEFTNGVKRLTMILNFCDWMGKR